MSIRWIYAIYLFCFDFYKDKNNAFLISQQKSGIIEYPYQTSGLFCLPSLGTLPE